MDMAQARSLSDQSGPLPERLDLDTKCSVSASLTSPGKTTELQTTVNAPQDVKGFYIMVSVETGTRLFTDYVIDITDR